ncbi:hypothetical protein GCM10023085_16220 [Actinomadura viridis]|uniref:CU044_5270 family protein n=1 Tax=Actinomadura viridis TaxID=58110 RepID=A0A931GNK4_9ACTN|nr:CU044_5270 family protein [Actinomadura viridis]MBG6089616.1 hypothetical protein [Actinomadura viridis]
MDEMRMVHQLLDPPPPPAEVRDRVRQRVLAAPTRHEAVRAHQRSRVRRLPLALGVVVAAAAIAVTAIVAVPRSTQQPTGAGIHSLAARDVLLVAADRTEQATTTTGHYWHTQIRTGTLIRVGTKKDPYVIEREQLREQWIARDPRGRSWFITRDATALPRSNADEKAWKRAGSPRRWHLNDQGVTAVPIEGNDLVTNGQWASAVPGDPSGRALHLGNWWATVRDVQELPADPLRLKEQIVQKSNSSKDMFDPNTPKQSDTLAFQVGAQLLLDVPVTPKVRAAAYRMLAGLPGVRSLGRLKDPLGRPGVGVAMPEARSDGSILERQLIIDPGTGLLLADQEIVIRPGGSWLKAGWRETYSARQNANWTTTEPTLPMTNCAAPSAPPECH